MDCRKHKHQGESGVCPSCLRDKLSRLPNTTTSYYFINHRSNSTTTVSSSPSSSPPVKEHHRRAGSMSMTFAVSGNLIEGLKKSRSMAHAPSGDSYIVSGSKKTTVKKKSGFWRKLLHLKGRGGGGGGDVGGLVTSRQRVF